MKLTYSADYFLCSHFRPSIPLSLMHQENIVKRFSLSFLSFADISQELLPIHLNTRPDVMGFCRKNSSISHDNLSVEHLGSTVEGAVDPK